MRTIRIRRLAPLVTVAVLALAGCSNAGSDAPVELDRPLTAADTTMDELYEAAQESGRTEVTVYAPTGGVLGPVVKVFNERYPAVKVNVVRIYGADLISRLQAEVTSGKNEADVALTVPGTGVIGADYAEEWFADYTPAGDGDKLVDDEYDTPFAMVTGIAYNSNEVSAEEAPANWDALLDPEWSGQIAVTDPRVAGLTSVLLRDLVFLGVADDKWMADLASQDLQLNADAAQLGQSLATGQSKLAIEGLVGARTSAAKGAPIEFIPSTSIFSQTAVRILAGAPNMDAAKLFTSWLFSPEAQTAMSEIGLYPLVEGAPLPEGFEPGTPEVNELPGAAEGQELLQGVTSQWESLIS